MLKENAEMIKGLEKYIHVHHTSSMSVDEQIVCKCELYSCDGGKTWIISYQDSLELHLAGKKIEKDLQGLTLVTE